MQKLNKNNIIDQDLPIISKYISHILSYHEKAFVTTKKKIPYKLYTLADFTTHQLDSVRSYKGLLQWIKINIQPFSLLSYDLLHYFLQKEIITQTTIWKTQFNDHVEETFTLQDRFKTPQDKIEKVFVVGPLHEIYVSRLENFTLPQKINTAIYYYPKGEQRKCIQLHGQVWNLMQELLLKPFSTTQKKFIPTPWNSKHLVKNGDYIILGDSGTYKVFKDVFEKTYII